MTPRKAKKVCRRPRIPVLEHHRRDHLGDLLVDVRSKYLKAGWKLISVFGNVNSGYTAVVQKG